MAMTPEGKVKHAIKAYLKSVGAWYCMPATGGYGKSGVPDFICCWRGKFIAIEAKAPGKARNTTELQDREIVAIHKAGGRAVVCDDVHQLRAIFDDVEEALKGAFCDPT
jgi:hypothetical protein